MMIEFELESEIEKTPTIFGIRAVYFFGFFGSIIVSIYAIFSILNWTTVIIAVLANGGVYIWLLYLTESFRANKMADEKIPEIISNNP